MHSRKFIIPKTLTQISVLALFVLTILGAAPTSKGEINLSFIYGIAAVISFLLLLGCNYLVRRNRAWFLFLFSSVFIVNIGYTLLSISTNLEMALHANRIAYFGSVFLPLSMLMIILQVTGTCYNPKIPYILFAIAAFIFLIAASPGILDIYYKEVSFEIVNGVSMLNKVYGVLHPLYLFYLIGYFTAMILVIIRAANKKTIESISHAILLAIAVFVNIGVWYIEQLTNIPFEMLSLSYIISELFLLGLHLVINENSRLRELSKQAELIQHFSEQDIAISEIMPDIPPENTKVDIDQFELFIKGVEELTATEKLIYESYLARMTTKEIMAKLTIKENTLKYHNKNIYSKLGVSSRKELMEIYKQIKMMQRKLDDN